MNLNTKGIEGTNPEARKKKTRFEGFIKLSYDALYPCKKKKLCRKGGGEPKLNRGGKKKDRCSSPDAGLQGKGWVKKINAGRQHGPLMGERTEKLGQTMGFGQKRTGERKSKLPWHAQTGKKVYQDDCLYKVQKGGNNATLY